MFKCGVFPSLYFPIFGLNTGKYGSKKTSYLDNFYGVRVKENKHQALSEFFRPLGKQDE